ncbi:RNA ligase/cyclic nucleotide phosphodiesterase [Talaromyces proteolyticus]|uniref:RNA ligase/cyclic nucleotide phosphodiesterase n=1 Tax=Talaromyces proteolyticus TaxID=1131652 RepID=A0AAD4KNW1_9EURO|nr:RNA ligase/cyclic nucleotide phosphodiesterase [Talaromyces proteolyticus]KAH8695971.1 RNA ligase/cyclic nucleotide phosphodiesterase [Talaromyces proteolyticus]
MAAVVFEDLSGATTPVSESDNPYQPLIEAANNEPHQIQARYTTHRTTRNEMQNAKILDPDFAGWTLDPVLAKLEGPNRDPTFTDERFCLVFWGRPPGYIRKMIQDIQQELREVAPDLWFMPLDNLHITVLEVVHSVTKQEVDRLVSTLLKDNAAEKIANITLQRRPRLIKPMVSYDAAAMALSFVPAAGEGADKTATDDTFTYHHLRRDVYDQVKAAGVKPASRYAVPSAHLTIGRFINQNGFQDEGGKFDGVKAKRLVQKIEEINTRLEAQYWPSTSGIPEGGEWTIGQEKGLDFRMGRLWYGGGKTVILGQGHE